MQITPEQAKAEIARRQSAASSSVSKPSAITPEMAQAELARRQAPVAPAPEPSLMEKLGNRYTTAAEGQSYNPIRNNVRIAGALAGGVNDVVGAAASPIVSPVISAIAEAIKTSPGTKMVAAIPGFKEATNTFFGNAVKGGQKVMSAIDNFSPTMSQDVRDAGNIASLLPVGKFATLGKTVAVDGTKSAVAPIVDNAVSAKIRSGATENIYKVLAPTTKANKITTSKLAPEILKRPFKDTFALTRTGLEKKAATGKELAGDAINDYGDLKGATPTKHVVDALEAEKSQYSAGGKIVNADAVDKLSKVQDIIKQYGDTMENNTLRDVRRIFDAEIQRSKGFQLPPSEGSMLDAKKVASDKIRGLLAEADPNLDKINKEYTFWKNLEGVMRDTNTRKVGQTGFIDTLTTVGGASTGSTATDMALKAVTFRWLGAALRSPGWKLASARTRNAIADSIATGDFAGAKRKIAAIAPNVALQVAAQQIPYTPNSSQTPQTTSPTMMKVNIP